MQTESKVSKCEIWQSIIPRWFVVILLSVVTFFMTREVRKNDQNHEALARDVLELKVELSSNKIRLAEIERRIQINQDILYRVADKMKIKWTP